MKLVYSVLKTDFISPSGNILLDDTLIDFFLFPSEVIADKENHKFFVQQLHKKLDLNNRNEIKPIYLISDAEKLLPDNLKTFISDQCLYEHYIEAIQSLRDQYPYAQFLFNSCNYIRFLFLGRAIDNIKNQLEFTSVSNLAEFTKGFSDNIKEYLYLNINISSINELGRGRVSTGSHGMHVTPFLYSNELGFKKIASIEKDLKFFFPETEKDEDKPYHGIVLRILLIDDKLGGTKTDNSNPACKALLIKQLMELSFDEKKRDDVCWKTPSMCCNEIISILQFGCENGCNGCTNISKSEHVGLVSAEKPDQVAAVANNYSKIIGNIQIVGVKNLDDARKLLANSSLRFDLIMMDYLLDSRQGNEDDREYATEFWGDGEYQYFNLKQNEGHKYYKTYDEIKANRGPMQRLWIFPITAFNQTFIDDLRNRGVRLIDYYWYLSRGADPINTPYLFIYTLNRFLQMMLEQAIFSIDDITGFIRKSFERVTDIDNRYNDKEKNNEVPDQLKALFSTEYTYFINQYAVEDQIKRDMDGGSLFAKYVFENFIQEETALIETSKAIRRLYHSLAFGETRDYVKTLERLYRMLDLFKKNFAGVAGSEIEKWELRFTSIIERRFNV